MPFFTEAVFENAVLALFRDKLGYEYIYGPSIVRDRAEPLHIEQAQASLRAINPALPHATIDEAIAKIRSIDSGSLVQKNERFTDWLQNGVEVNYFDGTEQCAARVRLIDYDTPLCKMVKRLLRKYKYPPEEENNAMDVIMAQCELWSENS